MKSIENSGRYKVLRKIGTGGMATVFLAYDSQLQCNVALKVLKADSDPTRQKTINELFVKEAQVLAQLNHPNVVRVFDLNTAGDSHFISMEYVEGLNLRQYMKKNLYLPFAEKLQIFKSICEGTEAIHARGIVHRDLKPENIMVTNSGQVKVMDFGIVDDFRSESDLVVGTPSYMSPEQLSSGRVDIRSDIFALGALGCELFIGKNPNHDPDFRGIREKHPKQKVIFPADCSQQLRSLLTSCLNLDPLKRPGNVSSILRSLSQIRAPISRKFSPRPSTALKFFVFSLICFAAVKAYRSHVPTINSNSGAKPQLSEFYSLLQSCVPDCKSRFPEITLTLAKNFPMMKCGDSVCSFLEKTCGLCPQDCGQDSDGSSQIKPLCVSFYNALPISSIAREARIYYDTCLFSLNPPSTESRQTYVNSLVACSKKSNNVLISQCAKENLGKEYLLGQNFIQYVRCLITNPANL